MALYNPRPITAFITAEQSEEESGHCWENAFSNISESHLAAGAGTSHSPGHGQGICLINIAPDSSVKICQETAPSSVSRQLSALSACELVMHVRYKTQEHTTIPDTNVITVSSFLHFLFFNIP